MTKTELNALRIALEDRQAELGNARGNREALAMQPSPDELDRIQLAGERDVAIGNLERDSSRLREVRAALRRIDAGTFGICVGCEANIKPDTTNAVVTPPNALSRDAGSAKSP